MIYEFTITGRPITKKNSMQRTRYGLIQSKQYRHYEEHALMQLMLQRRPPKPIDCAVYMQATYYMQDRRGWPDLFGLVQATADILEKAGIIEDDGYIANVDGSMIAGIDKEKPRVIVKIGEITNVKYPLYQLHPKLHKRLLDGDSKRLSKARDK